MKRKLAPEALYCSDQQGKNTLSKDKVAKRLRKIDPQGKRGLALLKEIEQQAQEKCYD